MRTLKLITLLLLLCAAVTKPGSGSASQQPPTIDPALRQALAQEGQVRANLLLHLPASPTLTEAQQIASAQEQLLERLPADQFELVRRYHSLPALTGILRSGALTYLERSLCWLQFILTRQGAAIWARAWQRSRPTAFGKSWASAGKACA